MHFPGRFAVSGKLKEKKKRCVFFLSGTCSEDLIRVLRKKECLQL